MNIKIANRLTELRKSKGYSQEALAHELGVSRQAVSKWERAEASPDTDNLIALAKLYNVSLDELLDVDAKESPKDEKTTSSDNEATKDAKSNDDKKYNDNGTSEYVNIGLSGIHVKDKDCEVHIDTHGIIVNDYKRDKEFDSSNILNITKNNKTINTVSVVVTSSYLFLSVIAYILLGVYVNQGWEIGWILFLGVPIIGSIFTCIKCKTVGTFAYPILVTAAYVLSSMLTGLWHPLWVLFLTLPLFYAISTPIDKATKRRYQKAKRAQKVNKEKLIDAEIKEK